MTCTICRHPADKSTLGTVSPLCREHKREFGLAPEAGRPVTRFPPSARANCAEALSVLEVARRRLSEIATVRPPAYRGAR